MKYILISFIVFAFIVYPVYAQQTFKLDIKLPKTVYCLGEEIELGVSVINVSNENVHANLRGSIAVNLINEKGEHIQINKSVENWSPSTKDYIPNYEDYHIVSLNDDYGKPWPRFLAGPWILDIGKYILEIEFNPPDSQKESIRLNFEIMYPEGKEQNVYNELSASISDFIKSDHKNYLSIAKLFEIINKKYPQSIYSPVLLVFLKGVYSILLNDNKKGETFAKELVNEYPNSGKSTAFVYRYLKEMKSKDDRIKYLQNLQLKSKNTLMEKFYKNLLLAQQTANN